MEELGDITPKDAMDIMLQGVDNSVINHLFFMKYYDKYLVAIKDQTYAETVEMHLRKHDFYFPRYVTVDRISRVCCLQRMAFTVGLMVGVKIDGTYAYRYCFQTLREAFDSLMSWTGEGHPPGDWIKRKGEGGDLCNPKLLSEPN